MSEAIRPKNFISEVYVNCFGLSQSYSYLAMKPQTAERHEAVARQLVKLILDLHGDVNIKGLCREVGFAETVCREAFCSFTRESLEGFSRRVRLETAANLLMEKDARVWEVALKSGYSADSSLDRAFRSYFGCTPTLFHELNADTAKFPCFAACEGPGPGRERKDIGVYTAFSQVTTFAYDGLTFVEKQTPDGVRHSTSSRNGQTICDATLEKSPGDTNEAPREP